MKEKPIATWSFAFSRASSSLLVFTLSSHWLMMMQTIVLIGRWDDFGFALFFLGIKLLLTRVFLVLTGGGAFIGS